MKKKIMRLVMSFLLIFLIGITSSGCKTNVDEEPYVSSNLKSVNVLSEEVTMDVMATGDTFNKKISKDNIELKGSFVNMKLEISKVKNKKITLKLSGKLTKNSNINAYTDGIVCFKKGAFKNKEFTTSLYTPIEQADAYFKAETYEVKDNLMSAIITLKGYQFKEEVKGEDISISGVNIEKLDRIDNQNLKVYVEKDTDAEVDSISKLDGQIVKISKNALTCDKEITFVADFKEASPYIRLDYAEIKESDLIVHLIIEVNNGKFEPSISKDDIKLGGNILNADILDFKLDDDKLLLTIKTKNDNQEKGKVSLNAKITIKEGFLINRWKTKNNVEVSSTRYLTQEDMDRSYSFVDFYKDSASFLTMIGDTSLMKGISQLAPGVGGIYNMATSAITTTYDLLNFFGAFDSKTPDPTPSDLEIICWKFEEISSTLREQNEKINDVLKELKEIEKQNLSTKVDEFTKRVETLNAAADAVDSYFKSAVSNEDFTLDMPEGSLEELAKKFTQIYDPEKSDEQIIAELSKEDQALFKQWQRYSLSLIKVIKSEEVTGVGYDGYTNAVNTLRNELRIVCNEITTSTESPFDRYDQLCAYTYNFDRSSYPARAGYRASTYAVLMHAISTLTQVDGVLSQLSKSASFISIYNTYYSPAVKRILEEAVTEDTSYDDGTKNKHKAYCYITSSYVSIYNLSIGEKEKFINGDLEKNINTFYQKCQERVFWKNLSTSERKTFRNRLTMRGFTMEEEFALLCLNTTSYGKSGKWDNSNSLIIDFDKYNLTLNKNDHNHYDVSLTHITLIKPVEPKIYNYMEKWDVIDYLDNIIIFGDLFY